MKYEITREQLQNLRLAREVLNKEIKAMKGYAITPLQRSMCVAFSAINSIVETHDKEKKQ